MSADFQKLQDVFAEALSRHAPDTWDAFLDRACAGDDDLRREAALLLQAHRDGGSVLDRGPVGDSAAEPELGARVGAYRLLRALGEGGMGTVFLAEQHEPVRRLVALKVIKAGLASRQVVARFEAERQALAVMDHPSIARVYDGGTTDSGRPYFVMELVRGIPITKYCDELHLTPKDRLELLIPVCQAVQHAHQKGIIHRDLKPSNVLVTLCDGEPVPKVIDFGVAKAIGPKVADGTTVTEVGTVVGTLEYMSPEQAEVNPRDVDTRSDVYALGVLLYELLTGTTPVRRQRLKETGLLEALRIIREEEPEKPSTRLSSIEELPSIAASRGLEPKSLSYRVRGELDWIVMKCLEKDRTRRYETASALALDLQRYLNDEPVQAGPPSKRYRLRKFVRRHQTAVRAGAVLLLLSVVGLTVSLWSIWQEKEKAESARLAEEAQKRLAMDNARTAEAKMKLAEGNRDLAFEALDKIIMKLAERAMFSLDPANKQDAEQFHFALGLYERIAQKNSDDPAGWRHVARAYKQVGFYYRELERHDKAEEALAKAVACWEKAAALSPGDLKGLQQLATCHNERGLLFKDMRRRQEAEDAFRRCLVLSRQLVKESPGERGFRADLASALINLGFQLDVSGKSEEGDPYLAEAHELLKQLVKEFPSFPHLHGVLGGLLANLGHRHFHREEMGQARTVIEQAVHHLETARKLDRNGVRHREHLGISYLSLARVLARLGEPDEAFRCCQKQLLLASELIRDYPRVPSIRKALAEGQEELARQLANTRGHVQVSQKIVEQAIALHEQLAADHKDRRSYQAVVGVNYGHLGRLLELRGKYAEAEEAYRRALDRLKDHPEYRFNRAHIRLNFGNLLSKVSNLPAAEAEYRQARDEFRRLADEFPNTAQFREWFANARHNLGNVLKYTDRPAAAEAEYRAAAAILGKLVDQHPDVPDYQFTLARGQTGVADMLAAQNRREEAYAVYQQALKRMEGLVARYPSQLTYQGELARCLVLEGILLRKSRRFDEADKAYQRALELCQAVAEKEHDSLESRREVAGIHYNRGILLRDAGRPQEAEKAYRQALAEWRKLLEDFPKVPSNHDKYGTTLNNLALLLHDRGEYYQARDLLNEGIKHSREAIKLAPGHRPFIDNLCNKLANLSKTLQYLEDHAQADRALEDLVQLGSDNWKSYHTAAIGQRLNSKMVAVDRRLTAEQRTEKVQSYADKAGKMLGEARRRCPDNSVMQLGLAESLSIFARWHEERGEAQIAQELREEAAARRARAALLAKKEKQQ